MAKKTLKGTYIGPVIALKGETALVMVDADDPRPTEVVVQFDNLVLGRAFTHGWHPYPIEQWILESREFPDDAEERCLLRQQQVRASLREKQLG